MGRAFFIWTSVEESLWLAFRCPPSSSATLPPKTKQEHNMKKLWVKVRDITHQLLSWAKQTRTGEGWCNLLHSRTVRKQKRKALVTEIPILSGSTTLLIFLPSPNKQHRRMGNQGWGQSITLILWYPFLPILFQYSSVDPIHRIQSFTNFSSMSWTLFFKNCYNIGLFHTLLFWLSWQLSSNSPSETEFQQSQNSVAVLTYISLLETEPRPCGWNAGILNARPPRTSHIGWIPKGLLI